MDVLINNEDDRSAYRVWELQARIYQWHDVIIEAGFKADDVVDYIIHLRRCNQVLEWVLLCKSVAYLITQLNKLG